VIHKGEAMDSLYNLILEENYALKEENKQLKIQIAELRKSGHKKAPDLNGPR
jgi:cell division septum initiation protein DivIVA